MGSLADQLRSQYRTSLNREASDADIEGWTSGRFGGGGINDWLKQIDSSHEAQQRRPATTPPRSTTMPVTTPTTTPTRPSASDFFGAQSRGGHNAETIVRNAYKTYTGRDADDAGLRSHLANPGGTQGAVQSIYDSDEAKAYWDKQQTTNTTNTTPGAVTPQKFQGFTPRYAMEGFDTQREQDTGKSAKDAFAYLSNAAPPPPINDKAALAAWFNQYIAPGMNALGHKVLNVVGDQVTLSNWQGTGTIDFARGAGADGGALAWQLMEGTYDPTAGFAYEQQEAQRQQPPVADPAAPPANGTTPPANGTTPPANGTPPPGYTYDANGQLVPVEEGETAQPLSSTMNYRYLRNESATPPQPSI